MLSGQKLSFDHNQHIFSVIKRHLFSIGGFLVVFVCCAYGLNFITINELFQGLTAKVLWTIIGMYIVGTALYESGDIDYIIKKSLEKYDHYPTIILRLFLPVTLMSGFMNNTPIVATFIPICKDIAQLKNISEKKLLLPLSYAAILGGNLTLIGATTHIVLNEQLALFSHIPSFPITIITPLAISIIIFFYGYLYYFADKMLPNTIPSGQETVQSATCLNPSKKKQKFIARFAFLSMIFLIITGLLHHFYAATLCALVVITTGCISRKSILACFNPQFIMIIIASFPLASFITNIGASALLSTYLQPIFLMPPFFLFFTLYCLIWLLTEFLNNLAVALTVLPIFIATEPFINVPFEAIIFLLMVAASSAFLTPIGYHTNIMVYQAGQYRLKEMIFFGLPIGIGTAFITTLYCIFLF